MQLIVKIKFGSHLYGTNTPESDTDYKAVYLPELKDLLLGRAKASYRISTGDDNSINSKDDIDYEVFSLHRFIQLLIEGQTVALDMIHAPKEALIETSPIWDLLVSNRHKAYTKNLKAFVGYARSKANKYGIKGSRIHTLDTIIAFLKKFDGDLKLYSVWDKLPSGEFILKNKNVKPYSYTVCGRLFHDTVRVSYVLECLTKVRYNYGVRAEEAKNNKNIDWKAVSHALRAGYELIELYSEGTISFPLQQADFLKEVKSGIHDFTTVIFPLLDMIMEDIKVLALNSGYPESPDVEFWDNLLLSILTDSYF